MPQAMDEAEADRLRVLAADISNAVEARIRGEDPFGETILHALQTMHIEGLGAASYWRAQIAQPTISACLVIAEEIGLFPCINEQRHPITAAKIAERIDSDALLVARIMRLLTSVGYCKEVDTNTYEANELSRAACSQIGRASVKINNELFFKVAAQIVPYKRDHGFKQFPKGPREMSLSQYTFGGKTFYDYLKHDLEMKGWFDTMMTQIHSFMQPWYEIYPIAEQLGQSCSNPKDVLLVDVGGSRGADTIAFQRAHPDLPGRLIVQDLPETLAANDEKVPDELEFQPYDFFTPQPVKGAKSYFFKWILHNWGDNSVREFLGNTVRAMSKDSVILIQELVLPETGVDFATCTLDIYGLLYFSGMERSSSQWHSLLDSCGLEIVKVWGHQATMLKVLECKLKAA